MPLSYVRRGVVVRSSRALLTGESHLTMISGEELRGHLADVRLRMGI